MMSRTKALQDPDDAESLDGAISLGGPGEDDHDVSEDEASDDGTSSLAASSAASPSARRKKKYRKAPQAPRRFKSPYILFSISRMAEYKKFKKDHVQVTSFSRQIASDWKELSQEDRHKWEEVARRDKLRYDAEKQLYTGPWQVPSGRSRKDPSAPKRPPSAFLFYSLTMRSKLKEENPDLKNTEISKLLGQAWKSLPVEMRCPYIEREHREREVYKERIAKWRKERREQEALAKIQREAVTEQFINCGGLSSSNHHLPTIAAAPELSSTSTNAKTAVSRNDGLGIPAPPPTASWDLAVPAFDSQGQSSESTLISSPSSSPTFESRDSSKRSPPSALDLNLAPFIGTTRQFLEGLNIPSTFPQSEMYRTVESSEDDFSSEMVTLGYGNGEIHSVEPPPTSDSALFPSFFHGDTKFDPPLALLE